MDLAAAGLKEQPFRTHGRPLFVVPYAAQLEALHALENTCSSFSGLSLIQGPALSGKSTLVRQFAEQLPDDRATAIIDGGGLNTKGLLEGLLRQFGYDIEFSSNNELLAMLRVFVQHQAASHEPPVVIIENAHGLNPSALRVLAELAELRVRQTYALKLVLVSDRSLRPIVDSPGMTAIARRVTSDFHMRPMSSDEAIEYLQQKLLAAGSDVPSFVFPRSVCHELWEASGGWPGIIDRIALLALARANTLPVSIENIERPVLPMGTWDAAAIERAEEAPGEPPAPPTLYVTETGKALRQLTFGKARMLIGRSEHNDVSLDSRFVSRHHMLLVRHGGATFLMDLNSTNGTFVNSRRVSNHVLVDNDVISVGNHRIKFSDPFARHRGSLDGAEFADTAIMKTLQDMRDLLSKENTEIMPAPTEDLPTISH